MKLILTAAWNPTIFQSESQLNQRRYRLISSIKFYLNSNIFSKIFILDGTIDFNAAEKIRELDPCRIEVCVFKVNPEGSFNGPSYLEGLLYLAAESLIDQLPADEPCFKISGGYIIKNIAYIAERYTNCKLDAVGFLHQNPLRIQPRYAMTSCMAMNGLQWRSFRKYVVSHIGNLRETPLESIYCDFLRSSGAKLGPSIRYPLLNAWFSTGQMSSTSWRYRLREFTWDLYSRSGFYSLSISRNKLL